MTVRRQRPYCEDPISVFSGAIQKYLRTPH